MAKYFQFGYLEAGTSALQIVSAVNLPDPLTKGIRLKSAGANANTIFISTDPGVTTGNSATAGYPLDPGEELELDIEDPTKLYCIAGGASQHLKFFIR